MIIHISKRDVIWNYIGTFLSMGMGYLLLPFLLLYLDDDNLGLWYVFMNLSNLSNLFIFGFAPSFARNFAYVWNGAKQLSVKGKVKGNCCGSNIDKYLFSVLLKSCKKVYLFISIIALILLLTIGSFYVQNIARELMDKVHVLSWIILVGGIFLNLYYGYYISLLSGLGKVKERNIAQIFASFVRIFLTGILMAVGTGILGASIAYLLYGLCLRIICQRYFKKEISQVYDESLCVSKEDINNCVRTIWPNTWKDGIVSVSDYLCTQAGTIICSLFLPLAEIGTYSLTTQLVTAVARTARSYQNAQIPALQSAFINEDNDAARRIHCTSMVMFYGVYLCGVITLLILGIPAIKLIRPNIKMDYFILVGVILVQFIVVMRNCYVSFLSTRNYVDYWIAFIVSSVFSVILSYCILSISNIGCYGIIISTLVCELVFNAWYWVVKVHKILGINVHALIRIGLKNIKSSR